MLHIHKYIRRFSVGLLFVCGLLSGCAGGQEKDVQPEVSRWTPEQIAYAVLDTQTGASSMTALLPDDPLFDLYLEEEYELETDAVTNGVILYAQGASGQEIAILRLSEETSPETVTSCLESYLTRRAGSFAGYLPEEAALLENAEVVSRGDLAALFSCGDVEAAQEVFQRAFEEAPPARPMPDLSKPSVEPNASGSASEDSSVSGSSSSSQPPVEPVEDPVPPEPPVETADPTPVQPEDPDQTEPPIQPDPPKVPEAAWEYEPSRLLEAWRQGDWSGLHERDQEILNICRDVIDQNIAEDATAYEKELAIHDWMLAWGRYDSNRLNHLPDYRENPDNDNPYGFLTAGVGICSGYTSTFQLFMDLLGIECISVEGFAYSGTEEHAWNMVRLDDQWYCVDVTWDDPSVAGTVSAKMAHQYFNVTSSTLRRLDHSWYGNVPEAIGTVYAWSES